ncbi:AAA family ATPase [Candidatus Sumerlaeota bacterium]|nr:AAA family ATPase [Candidatus Sumerlaeota bacterium]
MYKAFFGLEESPFNLTPDPRFLFLSQRHREAIAALMYGINDRKGFICLTGEVGSGKTTICRALMNELTSSTRLALILNPSLSELELLQAINGEFGLAHEAESKKELLDTLNRFLLEQRQQGNTVILIIDESQNLTKEVLEQIRMISNLETETDKLIQIVLMGQPELNDTLASPELRQLAQRITVRYHISSLTEEETAQYIRHRMFVARSKVDLHLETDAHRLIYDITEGIPRQINVLMDHVLMQAYVRDSYTVTEDIVRCAKAEMRGKEGLGGRESKRKRRAKGDERAGRGKRVMRVAALLAAMAAIAAAAVFAPQYINLPELTASGTSQPRVPSTTPSPLAPVLEPGGSTELDVPGTPQAYTSGSSSAVSVVSTGSLAQPPANVAPGAPLETWVYDQSGIVRVASPDDAWQAAMMTLLSIASLQRYDLEPMRTADAQGRQQIIDTVFAQLSETGHQSIHLEGSIANLLRIDLPMILWLGEGSDRISPYCVLAGAQVIDGEERLVLFDPVHGLRYSTRTELSPLYQGRATAVFHDPHGFAQIQPGEQSDRVEHLQSVLASTGYLAGAPSGAYDTATREAVREFQRDMRLDPSGVIDLPTALQLAVASGAGEGGVL